ncbi:hypothetical protein CSC94_10440 [Zhengella mangrovi]|uniref:Uncharacterized protein n=1 Tax=Zhengella mangrovi TaxID=1982044 RepID=A0A2G1QP24_9HYPH|nr:hypothetical protein CSC94_10440 [Zhengella mangrovi]
MFFSCRKSRRETGDHFRWNCFSLAASPDAKPAATFAGIAFFLPQFRTRNRKPLSLELAFPLPQFRTRNRRPLSLELAFPLPQFRTRNRRPLSLELLYPFVPGFADPAGPLSCFAADSW